MYFAECEMFEHKSREIQADNYRRGQAGKAKQNAVLHSSLTETQLGVMC